MSYNAVYNSLMTQDILLIKRERDYTGSLTDAVFTNIKGFVQYGRRRTVNRRGEEILATAIVFLKNDAPIEIEHEWYGIFHKGRTMDVETIDKIVDPRTNFLNHYELAVI
jgi:hypothetical protein